MALPVAFALGLWMYLNWTIVGSPTAFLSATWIVGAALIAFAVARRNLIAASLAVVVLLQTAVAAIWALWTGATSTGAAAVLLLRYNIRAVPLTVVAAAWLL